MLRVPLSLLLFLFLLLIKRNRLGWNRFLARSDFTVAHRLCYRRGSSPRRGCFPVAGLFIVVDFFKISFKFNFRLTAFREWVCVMVDAHLKTGSIWTGSVEKVRPFVCDFVFLCVWSWSLRFIDLRLRTDHFDNWFRPLSSRLEGKASPKRMTTFAERVSSLEIIFTNRRLVLNFIWNLISQRSGNLSKFEYIFFYLSEIDFHKFWVVIREIHPKSRYKSGLCPFNARVKHSRPACYAPRKNVSFLLENYTLLAFLYSFQLFFPSFIRDI